MYHHESEEIYKLLNYDAILFDVDGTLIDSAPGIINTLKEVFAMGVDTTNVNLRRSGPPLRKSFGEHFTDPALIEKATDLYRDSYAVKGSHECAAWCSRDAAAPEGAGLVLTATSKPTQVVTPILEEKGLAEIARQSPRPKASRKSPPARKPKARQNDAPHLPLCSRIG